MKKIIILSCCFLLTIACTISLPISSFDADVATRVAVVFTATALQQTIANQQNATITPSSVEVVAATPTLTLTPTQTQTPPADDPKSTLGDPDWKDDLSTGKNWNLESGEVTFGNTTFSHSSGKLSATSATTNEGYIWYLTYLEFENAYLEAKFDVKNCSGDDQYGLVFRAADYFDGLAYYYTVTCNGQYDLRRWNSSGSSLMLGMPSNNAINSGSNQTNTLGVWVKDSVIRLYVNNQYLTEITDSSLLTNGHFGLFINAKKTAGFTIQMDEIAYWLLD